METALKLARQYFVDSGGPGRSLFIADEAMCVIGRTGTLYAIEQDGVAPDLITVARGLGAGYQPIGAVLVNGAIAARLRSGGGAFLDGHTCAGHPVADAALAVLRVIERDDLLTQVRLRGAALRAMLDEAFDAHPCVGDIRGRGLLVGLELVRERATKTPFAPELQLHAAVKAQGEPGEIVGRLRASIDGALKQVAL